MDSQSCLEVCVGGKQTQKPCIFLLTKEMDTDRQPTMLSIPVLLLKLEYAYESFRGSHENVDAASVGLGKGSGFCMYNDLQVMLMRLVPLYRQELLHSICVWYSLPENSPPLLAQHLTTSSSVTLCVWSGSGLYNPAHSSQAAMAVDVEYCR